MSDKNFVSVSLSYETPSELWNVINTLVENDLEVSPDVHHFHNEPDYDVESKYFSEVYVMTENIDLVMNTLGPDKHGYFLVEA